MRDAMPRARIARELQHGSGGFFRRLRDHKSGFYVILWWQPEDEWLSGINSSMKLLKGFYAQTLTYKDSPINHDIRAWVKMEWKEVIRLIRDNFPRRTESQCKFQFPSGALCECTDDDFHTHCHVCGDGCVGVKGKAELCFPCRVQADNLKREIVKLHTKYYETYGSAVQFDDEDQDRIYGAHCYIGGSSGRGDREDFHSDG